MWMLIKERSHEHVDFFLELFRILCLFAIAGVVVVAVVVVVVTAVARL
jgi:hypothetical protein